MRRIEIPPRADWKQTAEKHGFIFHSIGDDGYWDESACYEFTLEQVEGDLEPAVEAVEAMCFEVVERVVVEPGLMTRLGIPAPFHDYIAESWRRQDRNLYGRMDFAYDGAGPPKLYEYNADTPTALYEASIFQWVWLEQQLERGQLPAGADQFNSLHEALLEALPNLGIGPFLHLASVSGSDEDFGTVAYLADCARQVRIKTEQMAMEDIGLSEDGRFRDIGGRPIEWLFKLYPWEWLFADEFGQHIPGSGCRFIEPPWKAILSNKGILPLLWEMNEGHPNLLPAYFADDPRARELEGRVTKPLFGREGENIVIDAPGVTERRPGHYGDEGSIVQSFHPLPDFDGRRPVCGCWVVASQPVGLGVRDDSSLITSDGARFVPHIISPD